MDRFLRAPRIFAKWVLVALGVVGWIVIVPVVEVVRGAVERIRQQGRKRSSPDTGLDGDAA